jgi:hypothetical protein
MRSFRYIAKCIHASSLALAFILISLNANAQGVTQVLGASSDATEIVGQCSSFGFLQATPINLSSVEINGQSLAVNRQGSFWYATVADNGAPNNRWIAYGVNGPVLKRQASSLLFTGASEPTSGSIMAVHQSSGNLIVSNSFATSGCGGVTPCTRFFMYNSGLGAISSSTMADFNNSTGTTMATGIDDTLYESNLSSGPAGVVLRSVDMLSGALNFTAVKNTSITTNLKNIAGIGSTLYASNIAGGVLYEFSTSTFSVLRSITLTNSPGVTAVNSLAVFVNQATGTPRMCRVNISTFVACNQAYNYTGSDGAATSAIFTDPVNNKVYEMRNDGTQDVILIRYTAGPGPSFAFDARFTVSPVAVNNFGMRPEAYAFHVPTQRITWIGSTGSSPAQVNSIRVCDNITR